MAKPRTVIIIVNWNAPQDTLACLDSLREQEECREILLLDNGSTDDSVAQITAWADKNSRSYLILPVLKGINSPTGVTLTLVTLAENLGFGVANNLGMEYALCTGADFVLLLNNDTVASQGFLGQLLATAATAKRPGIIGCSIRYFEQPQGLWFAGGQINTLKGAFYHRHLACQGIQKTEFVTGCLMLIPCGILKAVGLFDERFFLNVEDVEFSCRVASMGFELLVDCDTIIYHKVSASIGGRYSTRNQYYFHRNRMLFWKNRLKGWKRFFFFLIQFAALIPAWLALQLLNGRLSAVRGALMGYTDYWLHKTGRSDAV